MILFIFYEILFILFLYLNYISYLNLSDIKIKKSEGK
jgi:hypothetical protein